MEWAIAFGLLCVLAAAVLGPIGRFKGRILLEQYAKGGVVSKDALKDVQLTVPQKLCIWLAELGAEFFNPHTKPPAANSAPAPKTSPASQRPTVAGAKK